MEAILSELRLAARSLRRAPAITIAALITLAIGIGANTAVFSVVDGLLLRPLPYLDSHRLGLIWIHSPGLGIFQDWPSPGHFLDIRAQNRSFEDLAIVQGGTSTLTGGDEPVRLDVLRTSPTLFTMLGAQPLLGRLFTADDDVPGPPRIAILSHGLWTRQFGSDPNIIGRALTLDADRITVIGVLRPEFFLNGEVIPTVGAIERMDIYLPLPVGTDPSQRRGDENYNVLVRLKDDATWAGAQADVDAIATRIRQQDRRHTTFGMTVTPLLEQMVGNVRQAILVIFGSVALVLLVACANIANLLLARAATREREVAVRTALGAARWRVIRQLLTESICLSALGGMFGVGVAYVTLWAVRTINPGNIPRLDQIQLDVRVLIFTFAVSLMTGVLFGLAPAIRTLRLDLHTALKAGGRSSPAGGSLVPSRQGLRGLLVVAEVALSLTLLVGAGLLVRSFTALSSVPSGFQPERLLSLDMTLSGTELRKPEQVAQFVARMDEALRQVPGVARAGATSVLPFTPSISWGAVTIEGYAPPAGDADLQLDQRIVTPDYFAAMGIPLKQGRSFTTVDTRDGMPVVVIDDKMAARFWPKESPIGKRVKTGRADSKNPWHTVVGVVGDVKQYGLDVDGRMVVYFAHQQLPANNVYVVVRSVGAPESLTEPVIRAIRSIDPRVVLYDVATMEQRVFRSLARQRFAMIMLAAFAGFALLLATVGIYGVMSHLVSQRTRDIGIRMALGAEKRTILGMVFRQGVGLAVVGIVAGFFGASFLTRLMTSLLFGVRPSDAVTLASVAVLLTVVAVAASYVPARRATRVDPLVALRDE
jgi:putative ABC transport system permease protein